MLEPRMGATHKGQCTNMYIRERARTRLNMDGMENKPIITSPLLLYANRKHGYR